MKRSHTSANVGRIAGIFGVLAVAVASVQSTIPFVPVAHAATFTVTSLADDGSTGTLRWAITQANSAAGADTIDFANGLTGTITLTSNLPNVTGNLTVQGPGASALTVNAADLYQVFRIPSANAGTTLTLSDLTFSDPPALRNGCCDPVGGFIQNEQGVVSATGVTFKDGIANSYAVTNWGGGVATYTNCRFENLNIGIFGDHGTTPSTTSNTESDYTNRTYVVNSVFANNTYGIYQERFTKVTGSTFTNNNHGAYIRGLNRTTVQNSTFSGNQIGVRFFNWTDVTWTNVGANNRFVDGNTFTNNVRSIYLDDSWNNGRRSQQWSTVTSNTWDGSGKWITATRWNGSTNVTDEVVTVNSAGREWTESGNTLVVPTTTTTTTTTTTVPASTTTVAPTTTVAAATTTAAEQTSTTVASVSTVAAANDSGFGRTAIAAPARSAPLAQGTPATVAPSSTTTTTVAPTTTTTVPAPDAPEASPGEAGATLDGQPVETQLTRQDNGLVITAGSLSATVYGESTDGSRIALDSDGNLQLDQGDRVVVEGDGFEADSTVDIWLFSSPTRLGDLITTSSGALSGSFPVPASLEPGAHRLVLEGSSADGKDAVIGVGLYVGDYDTASGINRWLIIVPLVLATILGLVIPTTVRRRRAQQLNG